MHGVFVDEEEKPKSDDQYKNFHGHDFLLTGVMASWAGFPFYKCMQQDLAQVA